MKLVLKKYTMTNHISSQRLKLKIIYRNLSILNITYGEDVGVSWLAEVDFCRLRENSAMP